MSESFSDGPMTEPFRPGSAETLVETPVSSPIHVSSFSQSADQPTVLSGSRRFPVVLSRLPGKRNKCSVKNMCLFSEKDIT